MSLKVPIVRCATFCAVRCSGPVSLLSAPRKRNDSSGNRVASVTFVGRSGTGCVTAVNGMKSMTKKVDWMSDERNLGRDLPQANDGGRSECTRGTRVSDTCRLREQVPCLSHTGLARDRTFFSRLTSFVEGS